jgi:hypothetical protein
VDMTPCKVEIEGVAGSLQIFGCGTALFLVHDALSQPFILRVHNCLYGQGQFNLLSVSQVCQNEQNSVDFTLQAPVLLFNIRGRQIRLPLILDEGLFAISATPFQLDDSRYSSLRKVDATPGGVFCPSADISSLRWNSKVLVSATPGARFLVAQHCDFDYNLRSYCANFLAPPSIPPSRRQYDPEVAADLADLTTRFLGLGSDRLKRTIELNNGLATPASKFHAKIPDLKPFFPPGRWNEGKTPRVSKGKIGSLAHAAIGEVVFTDTFESGDSRYRYGQAYFDLVSHWGDVFPLKSRNDVGLSFADFCCRNWVPLYLIRDNIGENIGGSLLEECRSRNVCSAYICPRHPQQNYAEGYLGRVTAMASFAMVFAGAPLFMWIFAIRTAVFISNISASYYTRQGIWSTPYTLLHGESFPDASLVVPFGCAVLILRDSNDRPKFKNRAVLMVFVHYSSDHPLFTYAVYSPRTKRVLHRQDVIFLTSVFPMRAARVAAGMGPEGETLTVFRSPASLLDECDPALSFGTWQTTDPLPDFDDDVAGYGLAPPYEDLVVIPEVLEGVPVVNPTHPSFPPSSVMVPIPAVPSSRCVGTGFLEQSVEDSVVTGFLEQSVEVSPEPPAVGESVPPLLMTDGMVEPRRSARQRTKLQDVPVARRRVGDRWFYEPVIPVGTALINTAVRPTPPSGDTPSEPSTSLAHVLDGSRHDHDDPSLDVSLGLLPPQSLPPSSVLSGTGPTGRFSIHLLFPDRELPDQSFWVTTAMTVTTLKRSLADLMDVLHPLSLFVGPDWTLLDHDGFIVSRFLSDGLTPCPYLQPGSFLRVVSLLFSDLSGPSSVVGLAAQIRLVDWQPSSLDFGRPDLPTDSFIGASSLRLAPTEFLVFPESGVDGLLPTDSFIGASSLRLAPTGFLDFPESGVDGLLRPNFLSPTSSSECAISNLQRNGEDRDRLDRVSFGSKIGEQPSLSSSSIEGSSSYSSSLVSRFSTLDERNAIVQRQIDVMNTSSVGGGLSPHELVRGFPTGERDTVFLSPPEEGNDDQLSSSTPPSPKRFRSSAEVSGSSSGGKTPELSDWPQVTRRERAELLKKFRAEQKLDRRRFKLEVKETWEAEMATNKENFLHAEDSKEDLTLPRFPVNAEDAAEAYENYLFDRLLQYDRDSADLLDAFRSSLHVIPSWNTQQERVNPALIQRNTAALWEGLRRAYFGKKEPESSLRDQELSHEEVMANLRREIAELEERVRRRRPAPDSSQGIPHLPRDDDDDGSEPPRSIAHTNVGPTEGRGDILVAFVTESELQSQSERTSGPTEATASWDTSLLRPFRKLVFLSKRILRRVMAAKESIFKFGTFVPKNDREAESSPEATRWKAGRDLEWVRLGKEGTFDGAWTWDKIREAYPGYKKSDVGFLFYVYDFKFSGEHRVRLVFDGSRQSESTFKETYAPTVRAESVRLFHIFCVEEGLHIGQYDVPQAFLKADIDHDIFVYPPRGQGEFPGQILKLRRALYGGKQSAFLWFTMMNEFLLSLGFFPSPLDNCFYRRSDAVLILYCDDLRIGASPSVLSSLHSSLSDKFAVTTAPGNRFLGMDTTYDPNLGIMKLSMTSYIDATVERFSNFDLSQGFPYRELVGCLLWITLNIMGPELLRVKDLARLSNSFGELEYNLALKVLKRIRVRKFHGIVIMRNVAGKEIIPASVRPVPEDLSGENSGENATSSSSVPDDTGMYIPISDNELTKNSLCQGKALFSQTSSSYVVEDAERLDIRRVVLAVNHRYSLIAYGDASFAVGETKQSVTGFVIYLNGVPLLWGSLKQTVVVDSSCSAEFVAASVTCKHLIHAENMLGFLGFGCPKPYKLYTDSKACFHIATNPSRLGNVRHLQIRYHLVRCYVSLGDVEMCFCVTEEMLADLLTKVVVGSQDYRLSLRFYSLAPGSSMYVSGSNNSVDSVD